MRLVGWMPIVVLMWIMSYGVCCDGRCLFSLLPRGKDGVRLESRPHAMDGDDNYSVAFG